MKKAYLLFLLLLSLNNHAQEEKKWSFEVAYPVAFDDNFIGKNYTGIIDLAGKYRFSKTGLLNLGAGLNGGLLKGENQSQYWDGFVAELNMMVYYIKPKIFVEFNIEKTPEFHPFVYAGYNFMIFKASSTHDD